MSKFRASIAWLVLFTQVWTPALAQTLPIEVDRSVAGQRPVVGVSNGVPVINIAPPSAGGVSNNRYLQFNVGPGGVVLNNSGAASQTQTAGQVAGNPMLGNQRATTILNQVTANNPSRLQGMLEVAGNRANVIVANPAGITCNGCGFLNANRATLTTGKPIIGPDGSLQFDVTRGHIGIEGLGLNASNLSRMDLLSRSLQINAGIWADHLDVVAGAGRIDYGTGAISAGVGEGSAPALALDTAALGGMYANSIRLVGTEAGVGVNVGGNLTAMTGSLELNANGELRVRPDARLQAAQDLKARGATLVNDGTIIASRDLSLAANGSLSSAGAMAAGGELTLSTSGALRNTGGVSSVGNITANAGAFSNTGAVTAGQRADGSLGSGGLRITSGSAQNAGTLVAGGNAQVIADAITLDGGKIVSGEALSLQAANTLSNRGGAAHGRTVDLKAARVDNQGGALTANTSLGVQTGALDNRAGTVAATTTLQVQADAIDNRAGTLAADGALTLSGSTLDNRDKGVIAGDTVALAQTQSIDNRGGVVQAQGAVDANPAGALNNAAGEIYGKNIGLTAATLDNTGGRVVASGTLAATAQGLLDNSRGTMASQAQATLGAQRLTNAGGLIAGQGITLANLGVLDNTGGLLQADGTLGITAGSVLNRDTAAVGGASLGMIAKQLQIDATSVDNQRGRVGASQSLTLNTGTLNNSGGAIGSDAAASLTFSSLNNNTGTVAAGSALTLTTGALDNTGRIQSGADLIINADSLNNRASGEIVAAGNNVLNVAGTLANAGLIDGGFTRIDAGEVVNTGRIYGDRIAIQTPTLKNEPNAVIASRGDLDLGVNTLINREHALIYAGGDMRVGGALDASGKATGQATLVSNDSATIEVAGDAHIAAALLQNRNLHFASETVETGRQSKWYYRLNASDEIQDGTGMWFCNIVKSICGQTPSFLGGFHERRLLMPSERYPEARYGPPFDYSSIQGDDEGRRGESAPIGLAYSPAGTGTSGGDADMPISWPASFMYKADAKIWEVFGIERPSGVREPVGLDECVRNCAALQAQKAAYDHDITLYEALNAEIRAFNSDFLNNRMIKDFFYYEVVEIKRETRITSSDPGKILVGGDARLAGNVVNDKSQIVAGGTLAVTGGQLDNIGAAGERVTQLVGEAVWTYDSSGRKHSRSPYDAIVAAERIDVGLGATTQNTGATPTNASPGATAQLPPAQVVRVTMPGGRSISVVTLPPVIPTSSLYRVMSAPNAPYLIATDTQFIGQRNVLSSDFLFNELNQDPGHVLKRLGDGFYEQNQIAEQIRLGTGQRFVGDYTDSEAQYKGLMQAGADFAKEYGLTIGGALSEEQMKHLTSDIVWMVEQTVTLPDGTQQKVLAPQVYLSVKPGDLKGDGTLIAGRDTVIDVSGNVNNSGALGAREALVVSADNINNTIGTVQGETVDLAARTDITNVAGLIKGDDVSLAAGRDVNLLATTQSFQAGDALRGMSGTVVDGVARIDAKNLEVQAGRDITAQTAVIHAEEDARLQAGRDINLTTTQTAYAEDYYRKKKNSANLDVTSEIGSQFSAGGDFTMIAGRDVNARAADVAAEGLLQVGAGRDINLLAGEKRTQTYWETYYKKKSFMSSRSEHRKSETEMSRSIGSTFAGGEVSMAAGQDITVDGSNVLADYTLTLGAGRDINILASEETYRDYQYEKRKKSGFGGGGGFSVGFNNQKRTDWWKSTSTGYAASTVGSAGGSVLIDAGRDVNVIASNVLAKEGDIVIAGSNVAIVAGVGEATQHEFHEFKQSGLTIGVAGGMLDTAQQIQANVQQAGDAKSGRLAAVKMGQAAYQAVQATRSMGGAEGGAGGKSGESSGAQIQISAGSNKSVSETKRYQESSFGSSVMAGGQLSIVATGTAGSPGSGNIAVIGSDLVGKSVLLASTNDLILASQSLSSTETSSSKNSGWKLGIGIGASDSGSGGGINIFASGYVGSGNARGNGTTYRETQVSAQDTLTLISGRDTLLIGAQARADQIRADIGRNLVMVSQQDMDRYNATQKQVSAGGSFSFGTMSGNAYLGASIGKTKSNFDSVIEQTGLYAGAGGFDIYVGKHTQLDGAVIASEAAADKNRLSTETLGFSDILNKAKYSATTAGVSLGFAGASDLKSKDWSGNAGPSGLSFGSTSGSASGTTRAAVAEGTIEVRSDSGTGRDSTAGLSRDTANANGSIGRIFDKDAVREQLEFQQAFGQLGMQLSGDALRELRKGNQELWGEGKPGAIAMHAAIAGIGAALGGGNVAGAIAGTIAGDLVSNLVEEQINAAVRDLPESVRKTAAQAIVNVIAGTAGGIAGGWSGAGGAAAADMFNRQLHPDEGKLIRENASRYAEAQGITPEQAVTELTAQAQRQVDAEAANRTLENQNARAFLLEIGANTPGAGFVYFNGEADGSFEDQLKFASLLVGDAQLQAMYDLAWDRLKVGLSTKVAGDAVSGTLLALKEASQDVANYVKRPEDAIAVVSVLRELQAHASESGDEALANYLKNALVDVKLINNGGYYFSDKEQASAEDLMNLGLVLNALEGSLSRAMYRSILARISAKANPDSSLQVVRNAEVLSANGQVLVRQNPRTGEYEVVRGNNGQLLLGLDQSKPPLLLTNNPSFPDGISFRAGIKDHISQIEGFSQRRALGGAHNLDSFNNAVGLYGLQVNAQVPTSVPGITHIKYQIPSFDSAGNRIGYKAEVFNKTVYDPRIFSDSRIVELGQQAAAKGYKDAVASGQGQYTSVVGGISFRIYLDKNTGMVRDFHPN